MLRRLRIKSFKSIQDQTIELPRMTVLFGPNAAGKSNLLDALQCFSRAVTERTLKEAFSPPLRGYPVEAFSFPPEGLPGLLESDLASFTFEADVDTLLTGPHRRAESAESPACSEPKVTPVRLRYRVEISIEPKSGALSVTNEYLARLTQKNKQAGAALIERKDSNLLVRRRRKASPPRKEKVGQNHTLASDPVFSGENYPEIEALRREMSAWRTYYLDPRVAMRVAEPPSEVTDIGILGEKIAPYLYRLKMHPEHRKRFQAVVRTLRSVIPSVEDLDVDLDRRRGELDIRIRQNGVEYSTRVISEGTLRVLALCALSVNPWGSALLSFEEPENGVHPRRLELIAELLVSLAVGQKRQLLVTTHSAQFCSAILKRKAEFPGDIALVSVRSQRGATEFRPFETPLPLWESKEVMDALSAPTEDGIFEGLLMRGLLDE
jgi:predicted ATPase